MYDKLIFNSPWYLLLISFCLSLGLSLWLYYKNKKNSEAPPAVLKTLFALRLFSFFLIFLLLAGILLRQVRNETEKPLIIIALDNSNSVVAAGDSAFVRSGLAASLEALGRDLGGDYDTRVMLFGSRVRVAALEPTYDEKETDLSELFESVENNFANQNIGALVLVSDGIYNKGANPAHQAAGLQYPVYTVGLGDTTEIKDVLIRKISHNQVAYLGNNFPVEVQLQAKKFAGREVTVQISRDGRVLEKRPLKISSDNFVSTPVFTLSAEKPGLVRYQVSVLPPADDRNDQNNSRSFIMEVIDNKEKILLLAKAPHPDIGAIKEAVSGSTAYSLQIAGINGTVPPLKAYSLVIIHGAGGTELLQLSNACRDQAVPCWVIDPSSPEHLPGMRISSSLNRLNDSESSYDPAFGLFSCSNKLIGFINEAPAVKTFFGTYNLANNANTLINQRIGAVNTENPIFVFTESNGVKTAVFAADGLWRWKMRDFAEHGNHELFKELVGKTIQYLAVKNDKSLFRLRAPLLIAENEQLEIEAEVYNKSYELITGPEVSLRLLNNDNKAFNYTFSKTTNAYRLNIGTLPPGEYRYKATVKNDNQILTREGTVMVREMVSERINTVADHNLLYQIAQRSQGRFFPASQLNGLKDELRKSESIRPVTYSRQATRDLIDTRWIFVVIMLLLTSEWFFRKRYLSI